MRYSCLECRTKPLTTHWAITVATISVFLLPATPAIAQDWFPADTTARATIEELVRDGRAAGVVVGPLDADGGRTVIASGSPGANADPLDGESIFEIGSITKVFTGTLLADMVRRGEVKLSEPVANLLPPEVNVPVRNGKAITLLDLTTHHSGLPRMPTNFAPQDPQNPYVDYTVQQMYEFISGYELQRDPGEEYEYSNYATGLLGHALSLRAGMAYEALLIDRVLRPLGMTHTAISLTPWMETHLAYGHDAFGGPAANWDIPTLAGAGALHSNVNDMLIFAEANLAAGDEDAGLSGALHDALHPRRQTRQREGQPADSIGFNWIISQRGERIITWHNGGTGGYRTFLGLDLEAHRAVVVLTNSGGSGLDDLGFHLLDPTIPLEKPPIGTVIASTYRRDGLKSAIDQYRRWAYPAFVDRLVL
jgi:D-alanyl-D-alanine-carboxypeptidase/D-alanyl-D-alanine-endopeptidase